MIERLLLAITGTLETAGDAALAQAKAIVELRDRDEELGEGIAEIGRLVTSGIVRAGTIARMKAATFTTVCARCAAEFANEPGPPLCGPCWVELGKPERYLVPLTLVPTTEGDQPA